MTEPVICRDGKCKYKYEKNLIKNNVEDDILSQIEKDLSKDI